MSSDGGYSLSEWLNSINDTKEDLITDPSTGKTFPVFVVVRTMSYFPDTLFYANEINQYPSASSRMVYHYLLHSVRRRKRFSKWFKAEKEERISRIQAVCQVSRSKAVEITETLTSEELDQFMAHMDEGGT